MCKINVKEVKKAIVKAGMTQVGVSRELGKGNGYVGCALNTGTMPDEMIDKICVILNANREILTSTVETTDFEQFILHGETGKMSTIRKFSKKYIQPKEFNAEFEKLRGQDCDERRLFATALATKVGIGNKTYMVVPTKILHIPDWQRNTVMAKAKRIADAYDEAHFEPIKAFHKDDKLWIVDGAHRAYAYYLLGNEYIVVELINGTEKEIVNAFLCQSIGRKNMSSTDVWRASIKNEINTYKNFRKIMMEDCGVQIVEDDNHLEEPKGSVVPTRTLLRICNSKPVAMKEVVQLITKLEWNGGGNAYNNRTIKVLIDLLEKHGGEEPTIKEKLLEKCSGATYFESKVLKCKSNTMLYDMLVAETR